MIVFNFNVLARPSQEFGARVPDSDGLLLWKAMHQETIGRIAVMVNGSPSRDMVEHWLKVNSIKAAAYDILDTIDPVVVADKVSLYMAAAGGRHMYFDTDPMAVSLMMKAGITSILVTQPFVVRPEWHTEKQMRSWESLTQEIDKQKLARSEKTWGDIE